MAVAYVSDADVTNGTSSSTITFTSFAVSGSNPVLIVGIAIDRGGSGATVSSVVLSAGLSGGTPAEIKTQSSGSDTYGSIWAIPAPSGTGTITVNLSTAVAAQQANAVVFSGADQTTPCPTGDAASAGGITNPLSVTPTNVAANDAIFGLGCNANAGDAPNWDQTDTFNNNTTNVNMAAGYRLGAGTASCTWGSPSASDVVVAVRIAEAAGGGGGGGGGRPFLANIGYQRL